MRRHIVGASPKPGRSLDGVDRDCARLRAWEVSVFKDGTIRFHATNAILTQFRPSEVGLSIEKAHLLGYEKDMEGKPLESPSQLCALEVQDLVVPETCAQYLLKASKFLDDLLSSYYGLERFYNASKSEDLIGRLVVGLSPHTSVGVVGREA